MAHWPGTGPLKDWQVARVEWVEANDGCRRDILDLLRRDGPLPTSELPDGCEVPWRSSGWNNARNVQMPLMLMVTADVEAEIESLATWLGVEVVRLGT